MGRGRQSGHDRKEERKEKRAEAKNAKFEKSPRKATKGSLKKEFKAKQAVTESFRSASSISMDRKEENMLLGLIAMLDNVSIEPVHVHFRGKDKVKTFEVEKDTSLHADDQSIGIDVPDMVLQAEVDSVQDETGQCGDENSTESDRSGSSSSSDSSSDSSSSDSDSDADSDADSSTESVHNSKSVELPTSVNAEGKVVIGRQKYIRQLIRGERRYIREQQKANLLTPSAERVVARLKQSLQPNNTLNTSTSYGSTSTAAPAAVSAVSVVHNIGFAYKPSKDRHNLLSTVNPANTPSKAIKPILNSSVRINAHFDKTGEGMGRPGAAKLLVLQRSATLPELLDMFRVKFKATNIVNNASGGGSKVYKYNAIRVVSSGEILDGFSMLTLPDGEALTLFSSAEVLHSANMSGDSGKEGASVESGAVPVASNIPKVTSAAATDGAQESSTNARNTAMEEEVVVSSNECNTDTPAVATPAYWVPPTVTSHTSIAPKHAASVNTIEYNNKVRSTLTAAYQAPAYATIRAGRTALPIFAHKAALLETINTHPVTVVSGETGSGKTTQLPLYLMEQMVKNEQAHRCNIVCTQPRRIAAISVAERVNYECAQPGPVGTGLVGYQVRLDSKVCNNTLLTYCTTGVLLRKLQSPGYLSTVSHIILDEVHERGVETDFLMTLLKQQYSQHPNLRVILMSATMQENLFPSYFDHCPIVYVSGRTFPITTHYIEEVHKVVAQGQRLTAMERGKIPTNNNSVQRDNNSMDKDKSDVKKGYKGKHPRLEKDDPSVLKQRPPKFDAELIAELVIRIITTTNSKRGRNSSTTSAATIHGKDSGNKNDHNSDNKSIQSAVSSNKNVSVLTESNTTATAADPTGVPLLSQHSGSDKSTNVKVGGNNRLANLQRAAAKIRNNATTNTTTTILTDTSNTSSNTTTTATNTTDHTDIKTSEETGDAILVFLSGIQSIEKVNKALRQRGILTSLKAQVHILHGSQPSEVQRKVFRRTLPGEWKIVLATNIAETSITVSDVTHVVDAGYVKELRFDPANGGNSSLQEVFISRAAAQQRAGRAGRVRAGDCWRVYSQEFFESTRVDAFPLPEIQRVPLEEVVLQVLLLKLGTPESFLSQCLQPPSLEQVRQAIATLLEVRAVLPIPSIPLTALGYHLARMPVDVRIGKMLIYASLLQCLEPVLTIAAALGGKSPFLTPLDSQRVEAQLSHSRYLYTHSVDSYAFSGCKGSTLGDTMGSLSLHKTPLKQAPTPTTNRAFYSTNHTTSTSDTTTNPITTTNTNNAVHTSTNHFSDHIAIVNCYNQFIHIVNTMGSDAAYRYCKERYLNFNVLNEMKALREHFRAYLRQTGFVDNGSRSIKKEDSKDTTGEIDSSCEEGVFAEEEDIEVEMSGLNVSAVHDNAVTTEEINFALVKCVLCAGLYPNIVRLGRFKETTNNAKLSNNNSSNGRHSFAAAKIVQKIVQSDLSDVSLHPSSLLSSHTSNILDYMKNKNTTPDPATSATNNSNTDNSSYTSSNSHYGLKADSIATKDAFLVYYKKMTINKQFLFDATVVPHASVLLFSNSELVFTHKTSRVCVSGWIEMQITELHCILFRRLQREIEDLLRVKVEDPSVDISVRQKNLTYIVSMLVN